MAREEERTMEPETDRRCLDMLGSQAFATQTQTIRHHVAHFLAATVMASIPDSQRWYPVLPTSLCYVFWKPQVSTEGEGVSLFRQAGYVLTKDIRNNVDLDKCIRIK